MRETARDKKGAMERRSRLHKPDPEEFAREGTYLWGVIYPILLVGFYLFLILGWLFFSWKIWGIVLLWLYMMVGIANYQFVTVPASILREEGPVPKGFIRSVLITPAMLILFPVVHLCTLIWLTVKMMRASGRCEDHGRMR